MGLPFIKDFIFLDKKRFICTFSDVKPRSDPFANRNKAGWCPANTYKQGQTCFNFFEESSSDIFNLTYYEAKNLCEKQEERQLASFSRMDQNLASLCNSTFPAQIRGFWLGLGKHDLNVDEFKWADQSPFTFTYIFETTAFISAQVAFYLKFYTRVAARLSNLSLIRLMEQFQPIDK